MAGTAVELRLTDGATGSGIVTIDADKGREIAQAVADAIRRSIDNEIDKHGGEEVDHLEDASTAAVDAAMQALADAFVPGIYGANGSASSPR